MLKLIDVEDADSFAERAKMYYKKRPELIAMVQEFYRAHRSLAERYDQIKPEAFVRFLFNPPFSGEKSDHEKPIVVTTTTTVDSNFDTYSDTFDFDHVENVDSEGEDDIGEGEKEDGTEEVSKLKAVDEGQIRVEDDVDEVGKLRNVGHGQIGREEGLKKVGKIRTVGSNQIRKEDVKEEVDGLRIVNLSQIDEEENAKEVGKFRTVGLDHIGKEEDADEVSNRMRKEIERQREELERKNEEKREVIRQLSLAVGLLKEENVSLRDCLIKWNKGRRSVKDGKSKNDKVGFLGKFIQWVFF